jgi:hypothetical protein
MSRNYIDFISAYCDGRCERCAFTERCSHFAVKCAEAMCDGDFSAALELALGSAQEPGGKPQESIPERLADAFGDAEPSGKELEDVGREMNERRDRVRGHSLAQSSLDYVVASRRWLREPDRCAGVDDASVREAVDLVGWDSHLIHVKIMRALHGRDEDPKGRIFGGVVQNDWNGSAKVALISIERSERAWRTLATALDDEAAGVMAGLLGRLREQMTSEFPRAMAFRRPGFDD